MNRCESCGLYVLEEELKTIENVKEKVLPGTIMPSGECPKCGSLCYYIPKVDLEWLQHLTDASNDIARAHNTLREMMVQIRAPEAVMAAGALMAFALNMFKKVVATELHLTWQNEEENIPFSIGSELAFADDKDDDDNTGTLV